MRPIPRVIHVNTSDVGRGAEMATLALHRALLNDGVTLVQVVAELQDWTRLSNHVLKAIGSDLLPHGLSHAARFRMAADAGFTHVELTTVVNAAEADAIRVAADGAGLRIHSVQALACTGPAKLHGSAEEIEAGIEIVAATIDNAVRWKADTILLTAGGVDAATPYEAAYARSQRVIREHLLPLAERQGIALGIENVWYGFLLSPTEYVRFLDELASPFVRAYLDVGNMVFGHPHHWVRAAAARIVHVHMKDFRMGRWGGPAVFARPGDGAIDWPAVREAFRDIGYAGGVTTTGVPRDGLVAGFDRIRDSLEYRGALNPTVARLIDALRARAYAAFLKDLSARFDRFVALD